MPSPSSITAPTEAGASRSTKAPELKGIQPSKGQRIDPAGFATARASLLGHATATAPGSGGGPASPPIVQYSSKSSSAPSRDGVAAKALRYAETMSMAQVNSFLDAFSKGGSAALHLQNFQTGKNVVIEAFCPRAESPGLFKALDAIEGVCLLLESSCSSGQRAAHAPLELSAWQIRIKPTMNQLQQLSKAKEDAKWSRFPETIITTMTRLGKIGLDHLASELSGTITALVTRLSRASELCRSQAESYLELLQRQQPVSDDIRADSIARVEVVVTARTELEQWRKFSREVIDALSMEQCIEGTTPNGVDGTFKVTKALGYVVSNAGLTVTKHWLDVTAMHFRLVTATEQSTSRERRDLSRLAAKIMDTARMIDSAFEFMQGHSGDRAIRVGVLRTLVSHLEASEASLRESSKCPLATESSLISGAMTVAADACNDRKSFFLADLGQQSPLSARLQANLELVRRKLFKPSLEPSDSEEALERAGAELIPLAEQFLGCVERDVDTAAFIALQLREDTDDMVEKPGQLRETAGSLAMDRIVEGCEDLLLPRSLVHAGLEGPATASAWETWRGAADIARAREERATWCGEAVTRLQRLALTETRPDVIQLPERIVSMLHRVMEEGARRVADSLRRDLAQGAELAGQRLETMRAATAEWVKEPYRQSAAEKWSEWNSRSASMYEHLLALTTACKEFPRAARLVSSLEIHVRSGVTHKALKALEETALRAEIDGACYAVAASLERLQFISNRMGGGAKLDAVGPAAMRAVQTISDAWRSSESSWPLFSRLVRKVALEPIEEAGTIVAAASNALPESSVSGPRKKSRLGLPDQARDVLQKLANAVQDLKDALEAVPYDAQQELTPADQNKLQQFILGEMPSAPHAKPGASGTQRNVRPTLKGKRQTSMDAKAGREIEAKLRKQAELHAQEELRKQERLADALGRLKKLQVKTIMENARKALVAARGMVDEPGEKPSVSAVQKQVRSARDRLALAIELIEKATRDALEARGGAESPEAVADGKRDEVREQLSAAREQAGALRRDLSDLDREKQELVTRQKINAFLALPEYEDYKELASKTGQDGNVDLRVRKTQTRKALAPGDFLDVYELWFKDKSSSTWRRAELHVHRSSPDENAVARTGHLKNAAQALEKGPDVHRGLMTRDQLYELLDDVNRRVSAF